MKENNRGEMQKNNKMMTRQELASLYGMHRDTLRKILKQNNIFVPKGLISPKYQQVIMRLLDGEEEGRRRKDKSIITNKKSYV